MVIESTNRDPSIKRSMVSGRRRRNLRQCSPLGTAFIWCFVSTVGSWVHGSTASAPPDALRAHVQEAHVQEGVFRADQVREDVKESGRSKHTRDTAPFAASVAEQHRAAKQALQRALELHDVRTRARQLL